MLSLLLLIPSLSWGAKLTPLEEYYNKNISNIDLSVVTYVFARCTAVFYTSAKAALQKDESAANESIFYGEKFFDLLTVTRKADNNNKLSEEEIFNQNTELVTNLTNKLIDIANDEWENTGSIAKGFIKDDLDFCKLLEQSLRNQSNN